MTLYTDNPTRDADNYHDRQTRQSDACDAKALHILRTAVELRYVVENQDPDIWQYLVDIVDSVGRCEMRQPYAEARLFQSAKGLRDMLTACAEHETETYEEDE